MPIKDWSDVDNMISISTNQGFKHGELTVFMAKSRTGKSRFNWDIEFPKHLEQDTRVVAGHSYTTIEPNSGYAWLSLEEWCIATFGEASSVWDTSDFVWPENARWFMNDRKFYFRDRKDADWFLLKWTS